MDAGWLINTTYLAEQALPNTRIIAQMVPFFAHTANGAQIFWALKFAVCIFQINQCGEIWDEAKEIEAHGCNHLRMANASSGGKQTAISTLCILQWLEFLLLQ